MSNELKNKYQTKLKELNKHNKLYYEDSKPILSDADYDILKKEILNLENKYNFLKKKKLTFFSGRSQTFKKFC
tara:strand:- start:16 stop:234 length:219 start_codon:yes stop_codon:yes gene_type:complete